MHVCVRVCLCVSRTLTSERGHQKICGTYANSAIVASTDTTPMSTSCTSGPVRVRNR